MKKILFLITVCYFMSQCIFTSLLSSQNSTRCNILLKRDTSNEEIKSDLKKQGLFIFDEVPAINLLSASCDQVEKLNIFQNNRSVIDTIFEEQKHVLNRSKVSYVFGNKVYHTKDKNFWNYQWDMKNSTDKVKQFKHKSSGKVTIGVIDSGISYEHSEISSHVISVQNFTEDSKGNINLSNTVDKTGHGTSVVGQISANGVYKGIAPDMKVRMYRVFDEGNADDCWTIKAIVQAAEDDVDVINLSLGEYLIENSSRSNLDNTALINLYQRAINYAHRLGSVVVASVGDEGVDLNNQESLRYLLGNIRKEDLSKETGIIKDIPAELDNVVTVGSIDSDNKISSFSNYGLGKIDIFAAGGGSSKLAMYGYDCWLSKNLYQNDWVLIPTLGGKYTYAYGTSISAPKVTAAIGMIIEKYNLKNQPDAAITILYKNTKKGLDSSGRNIKILDISNFIK